jgi:hypothetical protein
MNLVTGQFDQLQFGQLSIWSIVKMTNYNLVNSQLGQLQVGQLSS